MNASFEERFGRFHALIIFALGLLIRIWLIRAYPPVYGGDTVIHLRNSGHIFLGHQLPALQILIFVTHKITSTPFAFRCVMALIGSAAGVGFYFLAKSLTDQQTALWAVLFFVTNPFLNEISIVPFQEILMLGALCFATYLYIEKRIASASLVLALACFTRYEAWIACPFFALDYLLQNRKTFRTAVTAVALFGWAPLAWIGWHLGLAGSGSYVIEIPQSTGRFVRWIYLGWIIVKNTPLPVLVFSVAGLYFIWSRHLVREKCVKTGVAFAFLLGIAVLCSAHGDDHAGATSAERFVSSREAAIPMGAILLLSGMGAAFLLRKQRWSLPIAGLISTAILLGVFQSSHFVRTEVSPPDIHLSYELAQFADAHLQSGERMLISARPFSSAELRPYLEQTRQVAGESGYERALENLRKEDLSPIDFQRTAVQSRSADRLSSTGNPNDFDWIAVWSDSAPSADFNSQLKGLPPVDFLHKGSLLIEIYHRLGTKK